MDQPNVAPPPVAGLGNYKGVMLCNRPPDDLSRPRGPDGAGQPPFKSTIAATAREQVGLPPPKREPGENAVVKTRGPSAALRRHCQWIKELQEQVREDQRQAEDGSRAEEVRKVKMQEVFKQQREAIRQMKMDRDMTSVQPHEVEAVLKPKAKKPAGSQKPLWAMTEAEREGAEDEEASDLIAFAEDLDFDRYINDLEFRECLQVVRDRAKKLQKEQDAFKESILQAFNDEDDDVGSAYPESIAASEDNGRPARGRRGAAHGADDRPDWDGSTACGEDHHGPDRGVRQAADFAMEANPKLKGVHSKGSVQKLVEQAQGQ